MEVNHVGLGLGLLGIIYLVLLFTVAITASAQSDPPVISTPPQSLTNIAGSTAGGRFQMGFAD